MQSKREGIRKSELRAMLTGFSVHVVRAEIISVVKEIRNCSDKEARDVKTLYPNEVAYILKKFD